MNQSRSPPLMAGHLPNYLKSYRKRSGLSQSELAFVVGACDGSQLSRYENQETMPPLLIALALEVILGAPIAELFAGVYESVEIRASAKIKELVTEIRQRNTLSRFRSSTLKKLRWLEEHPLASIQHETPFHEDKK